MPTLFCDQNSLPSGPGTRVRSAFLLPLAALSSWRSSLRHSSRSQALSLGLNNIPTLYSQPPALLYPNPESPFSRAHTFVLTSLRGLPLSPRVVLKLSLLDALSARPWELGEANRPQFPPLPGPFSWRAHLPSAPPLLCGQQRVRAQSSDRLTLPASSPIFPTRPHQLLSAWGAEAQPGTGLFCRRPGGNSLGTWDKALVSHDLSWSLTLPLLLGPV